MNMSVFLLGNNFSIFHMKFSKLKHILKLQVNLLWPKTHLPVPGLKKQWGRGPESDSYIYVSPAVAPVAQLKGNTVLLQALPLIPLHDIVNTTTTNNSTYAVH